MSERILVGYDDTDAAQAALDRAIDETRSRDGDLVVMGVVEVPLDPRGARNFGTLDDISSREGQPLDAPPSLAGVLERAQARVEAAGLHARYIWAAGEPAREIVETAKELGADLIVLGEHHHGFLGRLFGGDVAAEVKREAGCDVVVAGEP